MRKLKILFINDFGYLKGGVEVNIIFQAQELKKRGHNVKILTSESNPFKERLHSDYTFRNYSTNSIVSMILQIFNPFSLFKTYKVIKIFKPDLVYLHNIFYQVSPSVTLALNKIPTAVQFCSYEMICPNGNVIMENGKTCVTPGKHDIRCVKSLRGRIYEYVKQISYRILFRNITTYIAPSISIKRDFTGQRAVRGPISLNYNGIPLFKYASIKNYKNILYVGRLSKEKGLHLLLEAVSIIKQTIPDIHLDIVGSGPEEADLVSLSKTLGLKNNVQFHGQVVKDKVLDFYVNTAFVVVPSICSEAFSLTGVEALSVGRPVVGSDLGAIPEWLIDKKCGFLFTPGDPKSLAYKSLKLLSDKDLLIKMSKYSHKFANKFSIDKNINNLENLFQNLLSKTT